MTFEVNENRTQVVFITKLKSQSNDVWVQIASPIGLIEDDEVNDALEMLSDKTCGGMVKIGDGHFIRHSMKIDDLSSDEFRAVMEIVLSIADEMEERFIGGDEN
jgi:hypothetical protein